MNRFKQNKHSQRECHEIISHRSIEREKRIIKRYDCYDKKRLNRIPLYHIDFNGCSTNLLLGKSSNKNF